MRDRIILSISFALLVVLRIAPLVGAETLPTNWVSRGVGAGGGMFGASQSPHDSQTLFISCDMSHVLRTTNGGLAWDTIHFGQLQCNQQTDIQFTSDPNILYAYEVRRAADGGTQARPTRSSDRGQHWTPCSPSFWVNPRLATRVVADPNRTNLVLVATSTNLYVSFDSGTTYTNVFNFKPYVGNGSVRLTGAFFDGSNTLLACSVGLLLSTNGSTSFTLTNALGTGEGICSFAGARDAGSGAVRLYAVTCASNIFSYSTLASQFYGSYRGVYQADWTPGQPLLWQTITNGFPSNTTPGLVALATNNADVIYLAATHSGSFPDNYTVVKRTTTNGPWLSVFTIPTNANILTGWGGVSDVKAQGGTEAAISYSQPTAFSVNPTNANQIVVADNAVIHMSTNGGDQWRQLYLDPADENPAGMLIPHGKAYHGVGFELTVSYWMDWTGPSNVWVACADVNLTHSTDGGATWKFDYDRESLRAGDVYATVHHPTNGTQYAINSYLISPYQYLGVDDQWVDSAPGRGTNGVYALTAGSGVWKLLTNFTSSPVWLTLDPYDSNRLYVATAHSVSGGVWVTTNILAGPAASWTKLPTPAGANGHPYNIRVLGPGDLLVTYSARQLVNPNGVYTNTSGIFESVDGGQTWSTNLADPAMRYYIQDVIIDPADTGCSNWYACVWDTAVAGYSGVEGKGVGGLWRTLNRGQTWSRIYTNASVTSCTFSRVNPDELYVCTKFLGLWISTNIQAASPAFSQSVDYAFREPERAFFNPYNPREVWITSNGNALRTATTVLSPIETWRLSHFGVIENDSQAADGADPDGDGIRNLSEYALGSDPTVSSASAVPTVRPTNSVAVLDWMKNPNATDVLYEVATVSRLADTNWVVLASQSGTNSWNTIPGVTVTQEPSGVVTVDDSAQSGVVPSRFWKLLFSR